MGSAQERPRVGVPLLLPASDRDLHARRPPQAGQLHGRGQLLARQRATFSSGK